MVRLNSSVSLENGAADVVYLEVGEVGFNLATPRLSVFPNRPANRVSTRRARLLHEVHVTIDAE